MSAPDARAPERLFTYDFTVLTLAAAFGFCNIAVFYGLASHLERIGIDPAWRGAVIAAEPLAAFLARPFLSVRLTPRHALAVARISLAGMGLALPCYMFALDVPALFAVRIFHGLTFVCLVSAVMVLLTQVVPPKLAGRAFGYFSLASLVPYAIMPPLTEWLITRVGDEAHAYAWTALLTLPALALMAPLGARLGSGAFSVDERRPPSLRDIRENLGQAPVLLLLGANLLVFAGSTQVFFFIKPYALSLGLAEPGLFFTVSTAASIAVRLVAGPFYDRLPRRCAAMLALLALGGCMGLFAFAREAAPFFALAGVYGLCLGVVMPLVNASMFLESPPRLRGMNMNLMLFMMDAGYTLGPVAGGALVAGGGGFAALFAVSAGCACAGAGMLAPLAAREWRERND
ncbi:MFS transporter [Fundidesulfovibrio terrae]|uniref:MFS transporter n=1 Tax=Fundidesulfovibrio terrae TaxID=2922866 RepID=UPI001FAF0117|nr:MFS transporter [Fundidesulfovibrio terrae]